MKNCVGIIVKCMENESLVITEGNEWVGDSLDMDSIVVSESVFNEMIGETEVSVDSSPFMPIGEVSVEDVKSIDEDLYDEILSRSISMGM